MPFAKKQPLIMDLVSQTHKKERQHIWPKLALVTNEIN
jgi:hypothetical protein